MVSGCTFIMKQGLKNSTRVTRHETAEMPIRMCALIDI